ncbi:uncharacterized protein LTR77_000070 [Saxophila tyrrhenica]|uniref:Uncharacterized protein n=1 Tax=Saxophila tyrrhenica TaxID=1690608 RepID=A0AAV9PLN9_9PEZI|nr:hypothetical protein LTR77_000070 [Saxophila tyrrhenica]
MQATRQPSQIHWSAFPNTAPSSTNELWPPPHTTTTVTMSSGSDSSSGDETQTRNYSGASSTEWATTASAQSWRDSAFTSPSQDNTLVEPASGVMTVGKKHESQTTRSLRRFVEQEIGLGAIRVAGGEEEEEEEEENEEMQMPVLDYAKWEGDALVRGKRLRPRGVYRSVSDIQSKKAEVLVVRRSESLREKLRRLLCAGGLKEWKIGVEKLGRGVRRMREGVVKRL